MAYELLTLERRDDGVAVVTLANGKVNPLSRELLAELRQVADELTADLPGAVVLTGIFYAYGRDLPDVEPLANYTPPTISRIYSTEGRIIDEFLEDRRIYAPLDDIPDLVQQAFISAEDKNFWSHAGFDLRGIAAALYEAVESRGEVLRRHALKPALLPVLSYLGPAFVGMITGSVVVDIIFSTGGIGRFFVNSAFNRDYSVIMGITILVGTLTILFNLLVDVLYAWIDPKIRY